MDVWECNMPEDKKLPIAQPPRFESSTEKWSLWLKQISEFDEDGSKTTLIFKRFNDIVSSIKLKRLKKDLEIRSIKFDRLREKSDIRNMNEKTMPLYMRGQKRVVEDDIKELKEKNKYLIERMSGAEVQEEEEVPEEPHIEDEEDEDISDEDGNIPTEEKLVIH